MSKIIAKLNLNKTPQLAENNSLVMAKNIRLLEDGTIGPDTSMEEVETTSGDDMPYVVHHPAVMQDVDVIKWTILNQNVAKAYRKDNIISNNVTESQAYNFGQFPYNYHAYYNHNHDLYLKYYNKNVDDSIEIACYYISINQYNQPSLSNYVSPCLRYDENDDVIVHDSTVADYGASLYDGLVLTLAIFKDVYDATGNVDNNTSLVPPDVKPYLYLLTAKEDIGNSILIPFNNNLYHFIIINPVYHTTVVEQEIVTPAYDEILHQFDTINYVSQIVGLDNKIYFFKESLYVKDSANARTLIASEYPNESFIVHDEVNPDTATFDVDENGYITHNGVLFEDSSISRFLIRNSNDRIKIFEYDEVENTFSLVKCSWKYNGGEIHGCVTVNGTGEHILTICEYNIPNNVLVPIKHINLSRCNESDDETIYTQAPNIPISNLNLEGKYVKNIPAGVYQFFIRYKIHENFYTNWFPCSKELFAASHKTTDTLQGSLNFIDLHEDSNYSFIFTIQHLFPKFNINFEQYQLGFIISSEGGVFARAWKHFNINNSSSGSIYFDYNQEDIEEINIDDLLKPTYEIFNVGNVAPYKNKLYIANYKETDFNEALQRYAENIGIKFNVYKRTSSSSEYLNNIPLHFDSSSNLYDYFGNTHIRETYYNSIYNHIESSNIQVGNTESEIYTHVCPIIPHPSGYSYIYDTTLPDSEYTITGIYFIYNNQRHYIVGDGSSSIFHPDETSTETLIGPFVDVIKNEILGLTSSYEYQITLDSITFSANSLYIDYKYIRYHQITEPNGDGQMQVEKQTSYYQRTINLTFSTENITTTSTFEEANTLLPFTAYDFYIHYVKQNGIATNGYYIGTKEVKQFAKHYIQIDPSDSNYSIPTNPDAVTFLPPTGNDLCFYEIPLNEYGYNQYDNTYYHLEDVDANNSIIYPSFYNIECPPGYVGCFISIYKKGDDVAQCFNYKYDDDSIAGQATHKMDCMELDTLLYNVHENIVIKASNGDIVTNTAKYYSSNTINPVKYLGCCGHIEFTEDTTQNEDYGEVQSTCWVVIHHDNDNLNKQLIKLTPYIKLVSDDDIRRAYLYSNWKDINSPGYHCEIKKLDRDKCISPNGYYVSGSDIYNRGGDDQGTPTGDPALTLNDNFVNYSITDAIQILSNFNFNYLSLTNDLIPKIRTYQHGASIDGVTVPTDKQYITLVDSLLASLILELKSWFRDYTRKLFSVYDKNKFIEFNNTLRVSNVDVDEVYRYIYKFEATDYYNVPTQRGIITNVIAIANTVYVHCQHSLFKFSDNKTIQAQEEEVVLQENDIFNSGISEVFDAQYGYAGLIDRKHSLVTYNAYVFYDSIAKIIYAFGGEQQIANIGTTIQKIIDYVNPTDVRFVADELNNRFFVNLINSTGNCCLSFNFVNKAFISIHDIHFKFGFHSRRHTYFVHDNYTNTTLTGWSIYRLTDYIETELQTVPPTYKKNYITYQNCYTPSIIYVQDNDGITTERLNIVNACVDIIINTEYEKIKVLNYISWICSEILNYGNTQNFVAEELLNKAFPGTKIRIYTDSTNTELINLVDNNGIAYVSNEQRNIDSSGNIQANPNSWKYPQYNCGVWSMNYFRDVRNTTDTFSYKSSANKITGGTGHSQTVDLTPKTQRLSLTQENSLIYGKYFVVRFIFNNRNFKLENVIVRMNDYEKTK